MNFTELIKHQHDFQKTLNAWPEDHEQITYQILEEIGEVCRELRPISRWWGWQAQDKEAIDQAKLIEELADILHFILLGLALESDLEILEDIEIQSLDSLWLNYEENRMTDHDQWVSYLINIPMFFRIGKIYDATVQLIIFCNENGISRDDLEQAYLAKLQQNYSRIKTQEKP